MSTMVQSSGGGSNNIKIKQEYDLVLQQNGYSRLNIDGDNVFYDGEETTGSNSDTIIKLKNIVRYGKLLKNVSPASGITIGKKWTNPNNTSIGGGATAVPLLIKDNKILFFTTSFNMSRTDNLPTQISDNLGDPYVFYVAIEIDNNGVLQSGTEIINFYGQQLATMLSAGYNADVGLTGSFYLYDGYVYFLVSKKLGYNNYEYYLIKLDIETNTLTNVGKVIASGEQTYPLLKSIVDAYIENGVLKLWLSYYSAGYKYDNLNIDIENNYSVTYTQLVNNPWGSIGSYANRNKIIKKSGKEYITLTTDMGKKKITYVKEINKNENGVYVFANDKISNEDVRPFDYADNIVNAGDKDYNSITNGATFVDLEKGFLLLADDKIRKLV